MTVKRTLWSPDSCECKIEYEWNDEEPDDQRVHTLKTIKKCSVHEPLSNSIAYETVITKENPRKNTTYRLLLDNAPSSVFDIDPVSGERILKEGLGFRWEWSGEPPDRILSIFLDGINLNNNQKNAIRNVLNNHFGINQVLFP